MTMPEMALRFILNNPSLSTIIPGMRKVRHVESNLAASDAGALRDELHRATARAPLVEAGRSMVAVSTTAALGGLYSVSRRVGEVR